MVFEGQEVAVIHEIKKLMNEEGMVILHYVPLDEEGTERFQGVVHMGTPAGLIPIEFDFPESVTTPQEAFAAFRETADAYVKQMEEEAPRIMTPDMLG